MFIHRIGNCLFSYSTINSNTFVVGNIMRQAVYLVPQIKWVGPNYMDVAAGRNR